MKQLSFVEPAKRVLSEEKQPLSADEIWDAAKQKGYDAEVFELSTAVGSTSLRLYSFEVKRELSFGNLRESFFQTVSNSSWANEAYLVAAKSVR